MDLLVFYGTFPTRVALPIIFFFAPTQDQLIKVFLPLSHLSWLLFYS